MSAANRNSFMVIKKTLEEFGALSGLRPNLLKSQVYITGVQDDMVQNLRAIVDIPLGQLPIRYLTIPLVSTKLSFRDCLPIFSRIQQRIKSWAVKNLSYAGRVQLIQSVLIGICAYWCSMMILPEKVISIIDSMRFSFL